MAIINCKISNYVDMATIGCTKSVEEYVESLFLDNDTIVHCIDNGKDYSINDSESLVEYIKARTENNNQ